MDNFFFYFVSLFVWKNNWLACNSKKLLCFLSIYSELSWWNSSRLVLKWKAIRGIKWLTAVLAFAAHIVHTDVHLLSFLNTPQWKLSFSPFPLAYGSKNYLQSVSVCSCSASEVKDDVLVLLSLLHLDSAG